MPSREELQAAFVACRRATDIRNAYKILKDVADVAELDDVSKDDYAAVIAAFEAATPEDARPAPQAKPKSLEETRAEFAAMNKRAFARFNHPPRRSEG